MKAKLLELSAVCVTGCLLLSACELPPAETAEAPPPGETTTTEVTFTQTDPGPELEPPPPVEATPPPEPVEDGVRETDEQTRGRLPASKIAPVLQAHTPRFNQCYAKALAAAPGLQGTVTLLIVISPEGTVPHAEVVQERTTLASPQAQACLIDEAKTLKFDAPVGGRVVTHYPLEFKPTPASPLAP